MDTQLYYILVPLVIHRLSGQNYLNCILGTSTNPLKEQNINTISLTMELILLNPSEESVRAKTKECIECYNSTPISEESIKVLKKSWTIGKKWNSPCLLPEPFPPAVIAYATQNGILDNSCVVNRLSGSVEYRESARKNETVTVFTFLCVYPQTDDFIRYALKRKVQVNVYTNIVHRMSVKEVGAQLKKRKCGATGKHDIRRSNLCALLVGEKLDEATETFKRGGWSALKKEMATYTNAVDDCDYEIVE